MRVQYASDLHLEFAANTHFLEENPLEVKGEILLLAGDCGYLGERSVEKHPFWDWCAENYVHTYIVPGNHEYYAKYDLRDTLTNFRYDLRPNVSWVNNVAICHENIDFFFTTLWSVVDPARLLDIQMGMADFRQIKYGNKQFSAYNYEEVHEKCLRWLKLTLQQSTAEYKVVISHYCPSELCNDVRYKGSPLNSAFVVELSDFIIDSGIDYWIYGHTHQNMPEITIGKTKLLTNQLGYVKYLEHDTFDRSACVYSDHNK